MNTEQREAIRAAHLRRRNCGKCGNSAVEIVDGSRVGGMPGLQYKNCNACGHAEAVKMRRIKATLQ